MAISEVTRPWTEGATEPEHDPELSSRWEALVDPVEPERDESDDLADSSMALYLRDISRVPLLTAEEEVMLAKQPRSGRGGPGCHRWARRAERGGAQAARGCTQAR
jgi:hypothetical protein